MQKSKITHRSDGRYQKSIVDEKTKKRIYFYGDSEREVTKKIMEYSTKVERGRTFDEVASEWWDDTYEELAHQTLKGYKPALKRAVDYFNSISIKEILPKDILRFFKRMNERGFAAKTVSNQRIIINQIFNHAVVEGDIQYNPCASVKLPKNTKKSIRPPASSADESATIESAYPWLFPLVALTTGLRKGEILALQWRDIDFEENTISVTKSVEHIGKTPHIKSTKTEAGERLVPLLDILKERLEAVKGKPSSYIFSEDGGKSPLYEHRYTKLYNEYRKATGVKATAHQFRHSYATIAVEEDVNPKDLQNALGHADIATTMNIYAAARKRSVQKVANKLNAKYSGD